MSEKSKRRRVTRRAAPLFQSATIVVAGLQRRAQKGDVARYRKLLFSSMGHLLVAPPTFIGSIYQRALSAAWASRSVNGLESLILLGMQNSFMSRDQRGFDLGRTTLRAFPPSSEGPERPVLFMDRSTSMLTVLSREEYAQARKDILTAPRKTLLSYGIAGTVRMFDAPEGQKKQDHAHPKPFDGGTCRAYVSAVLIVGGVLVVVFVPGAAEGLGMAAGSGGLARAVAGGGLGSLFANAGPAALLCSGVEWLKSDDDGVIVDPEPTGNGPDAGAGVEPVELEGDDLVHGTVEEGDGFTATQINGPTSFTLVGSDGTTQTVVVDEDGTTTVTTTDTDGNVTDVTSYDGAGNSSSGPPPDDSTPPPDDDGYPTPDGDGGGGPRPNPAALSGTLVAQSFGSVTQGMLAGRGSTFVIGGASLTDANGSASSLSG